MNEALLAFAHPELPPAKGHNKVRQVHDLGDCYLILTTDRISAFDVIMANGIPDKGRILNQMSAFWFAKFAELQPHHVISIDDSVIANRLGFWDDKLAGRCLLARKAQPLKIECVARGYLAGSLLKEYRAHGPNVHGLNLPEGLQEASELPEPIFTPATKAEEGHDENLSEVEAIALVGESLHSQAKRATLAIYAEARRYAAERGIILADTKFEFGTNPQGELIWIDEALTPDSSRFWPAEEVEPGKTPPSFDKQYLRDWLEAVRFNKQPPGPELPPRIIDATRERYVEAYERLTGTPLDPHG